MRDVSLLRSPNQYQWRIHILPQSGKTKTKPKRTNLDYALFLISYFSVCSVLGCDLKVLWELKEDDKTEQEEEKQEE